MLEVLEGALAFEMDFWVVSADNLASIEGSIFEPGPLLIDSLFVGISKVFSNDKR